MKMQNLKVKIGIGADYPYQVDTGLLVPIEGKYYLPTSYKDPIPILTFNFCIFI